MDLSQLPSPFYRVSLKAIVLDDKKRLLVGKTSDGKWETPGGGWEHNETLEECLRREIQEELGVGVNTTGRLSFLYRGQNPRGYMVVYLAFPVTLSGINFSSKDLVETKFVTKEELMELDFDADEALIKDCTEFIWPRS